MPSKDPAVRKAWYARNAAQQRAQSRAWRAAHKDKVAENNRRWREENREAYMRNKRAAALSMYGLSLAQYEGLSSQQGGVCAICERLPIERTKSGTLHVDHHHATGAARGLLCGNCNRGLGMFMDSPELLRRAADYLRQHAQKSVAS